MSPHRILVRLGKVARGPGLGHVPATKASFVAECGFDDNLAVLVVRVSVVFNIVIRGFPPLGDIGLAFLPHNAAEGRLNWAAYGKLLWLELHQELHQEGLRD